MLFRRPSRRPRKIGESKAQYDRRVGKRPPRTVGRPTTTGRVRVPPKQATAKPVTKPKAVTVIGKKPPTQKVKAKIDPDRRQPIGKKPTVDPKKPPRPRVTRPKTKKSLEDLAKELAKNQPKRPKKPPRNEVGLPPKRPIAIRPGLTDPKGKPISTPTKPPSVQPPPRCKRPDILKNKKYIDLNQKELLTLQKQKYEIDSQRQKYFADQTKASY